MSAVTGAEAAVCPCKGSLGFAVPPCMNHNVGSGKTRRNARYWFSLYPRFVKRFLRSLQVPLRGTPREAGGGTGRSRVRSWSGNVTNERVVVMVGRGP